MDSSNDPVVRHAEQYRFIVVSLPNSWDDGRYYVVDTEGDHGHLVKRAEGITFCEVRGESAAKHVAEALNRLPPEPTGDPGSEPF